MRESHHRSILTVPDLSNAIVVLLPARRPCKHSLPSLLKLLRTSALAKHLALAPPVAAAQAALHHLALPAHLPWAVVHQVPQPALHRTPPTLHLCSAVSHSSASVRLQWLPLLCGRRPTMLFSVSAIVLQELGSKRFVVIPSYD